MSEDVDDAVKFVGKDVSKRATVHIFCGRNVVPFSSFQFSTFKDVNGDTGEKVGVGRVGDNKGDTAESTARETGSLWTSEFI